MEHKDCVNRKCYCNDCVHKSESQQKSDIMYVTEKYQLLVDRIAELKAELALKDKIIEVLAENVEFVLKQTDGDSPSTEVIIEQATAKAKEQS